MAGTLVADVLQDGAGNSTAMDNAIYGSAKAWVRFTVSGGACTVNAYYNVSSVSYLSTGQYQVNYTNSFADTNYSIFVSGGESQTNYSYQSIATSSIQPVSRQDSGTFVNPSTVCVAVHR